MNETYLWGLRVLLGLNLCYATFRTLALKSQQSQIEHYTFTFSKLLLDGTLYTEAERQKLIDACQRKHRTWLYVAFATAAFLLLTF